MAIFGIGPSIPMPPALRDFLGLDDEHDRKRKEANERTKRRQKAQKKYSRSADSDAARAASFLPRENARPPRLTPSTPVDPVTIQSILDMLGGPIRVGGIPTPDRNAFLAPYDQAEQAARRVHGEVIPTIDNIYASLQTGMGEQEQQFVDRMGALTTAAGERQQRMASDIPVQQQIAVDPGEVVGSLAAELAANNATNQQAQQTRNQADLALLDEILAMGQADSASVQQSAEAVGAGARSNADAQLQQALNAIGMGRAQAERDYAQQASSIAAENARLQVSAAEAQMRQQEMALQEWDRINSDILKQASDQSFGRDMTQIQGRDPDLFQGIMGTIDAVGRDRTEYNFLAASSIIQQAVESKQMTPQDGQELQEWVRRYYMPEQAIDLDTFVRFGGDPAYFRSKFG